MNALRASVLATVLGLFCILQTTHGAAVMSIDLGSEWMKVRGESECQAIGPHNRSLSFFVASGGHRVPGRDGRRAQQRVETKNAGCHCVPR